MTGEYLSFPDFGKPERPLNSPDPIEQLSTRYVAELWRQHYEQVFTAMEPMPERLQVWQDLRNVLQPANGIRADEFRAGCEVQDGSCMLFDRILAGSLRRDIHAHTALGGIDKAPKRDRPVRDMWQESCLEDLTEVVILNWTIRDWIYFRTPGNLPLAFDQNIFLDNYIALGEVITKVDDWVKRNLPFGESYLSETQALQYLVDLMPTSTSPSDRRVFRI